MRYCVNCGSEYEDSVTECADCPGFALVDAEGMRQRGLPLPGEQDRRTFARAGTANDPLTAETFVRLLESAHIPVISHAHRGGTVDVLTTGVVSDWWEILVPEHAVPRAAVLLREARASIEANADEAARAAEEEERASESPAPP
ncbi:hypothetical protein P2318_10920 [Myxococcaceae bacterium GXIMD 01537]